MKIPKILKNKKVMIVAVLILAVLFTTRVGFIAVENLSNPVIEGTVSITAFEVNLDREETWTWRIGEPVPTSFDGATVKGTIDLIVLMLGDPVDMVKLVIVGTSTGASSGGAYNFIQASTSDWRLYFDTTTLNDGEYTFTLSYIVDTGDPNDETDDSGNMVFSSFAFLADDGEVVVGISETTMALILLGVGGGIGLVFIIRRLKKK